MKVIQITDLTYIHEESIATIGFFDGVHLGHRYLLSQLKELGKKSMLKTAVITFFVHPRKVLHKDYQPQLLNTFEERIQQLQSTGIDFCYVINFTQSFSDLSAYDFMCKILKKQLSIQKLLIGYDHRFGKDRTTNYEEYIEYGKACDIEVSKIDEFNQNKRHISSTAIRNLILEGNIKEANKLLSYNYSLEGIVNQGNKIGRTIGFPTANINLCDKDKVIPAEGVYAVNACINKKLYPGMAYIGKRPTVSSDGEKRIEVNLFNFNKEIYGEKLQLIFLDFIRPDIQFNNLKDLTLQLETDRQTIMNYFDR